MLRIVSLKVDGLSHRTSIDDLEALFDKYGRIGDVYIPKVSVKRLPHSVLRSRNYYFFFGSCSFLAPSVSIISAPASAKSLNNEKVEHHKN